VAERLGTLQHGGDRKSSAIKTSDEALITSKQSIEEIGKRLGVGENSNSETWKSERSEKLAVRSKAMKHDNTLGFLVDQNQIGANVAIAIALPWSGEGMIREVGRKSLPREEQL
jgi:hypothetical protein